MAIVTTEVYGDGVNTAFTVGYNVLSKSHARVHFNYDEIDHLVSDTSWELIGRSTIVFEVAPTNGYLIKISTSDDEIALAATPNEYNLISDNIPSVVSVANNIEAIVGAVGIRDLSVAYNQLDAISAGSIDYSALDSTLVFNIPRGIDGEKGDLPVITLTLDINGDLSYDVTYTNDIVDGIGAY